MWIISKKAIREFTKLHADAQEPLLFWYGITKRARWSNLIETRDDFPHADPVDEFTVFNVGSNKYRFVSAINYQYQMVYIRHILTHAEYSKGKWKL